MKHFDQICELLLGSAEQVTRYSFPESAISSWMMKKTQIHVVRLERTLAETKLRYTNADSVRPEVEGLFEECRFVQVPV